MTTVSFKRLWVCALGCSSGPGAVLGVFKNNKETSTGAWTSYPISLVNTPDRLTHLPRLTFYRFQNLKLQLCIMYQSIPKPPIPPPPQAIPRHLTRA